MLTADDIAKVAKSVSKPLFVNMGFGIKSRPTTPLIGPEDLQAMGVSAVVYPRLLTSAALRGMMNAMSVFKDEVVSANGTPDRSDLMIGFDDLNQLTGMAFLDNIESQFTS